MELLSLLDGLSADEKKSNVDVLLNMLDDKNIAMKTNLNSDQIYGLTKMKYLLKIQDPENKDTATEKKFDDTINYWMALTCSKDGLRAKQIIEALKEMRQQEMEVPIFPRGVPGRG